MELVDKILKGDVRAAARLMTMIENGDAEARAALKSLYPHTGSAHIIGITGPPGSGKSTLADRLTEELRKRDKTVGIVAVDPTSPFTGGAILGDRIRMQSHSLDAGVFIRSMATRGHLGGLARATNEIVDVMDAAGKEVILIETVGVGQDEVEVVGTAHTCVVVSVPGLGDEVQTFKAGVLEIGDLFVVNKADREGANRTATELEMMLHMAPKGAAWSPKVLKTVATTGEVSQRCWMRSSSTKPSWMSAIYRSRKGGSEASVHFGCCCRRRSRPERWSSSIGTAACRS
ncbi:putative LAO/AO transport system ATPase, partial, 5' end [Candidatus Methylomirabilis oxygeniifera]|uniref:Putative LAO/AO transport system ATPase, partial, 5' end n=1 Tax=Methylomirabilis oxygeniifera TaxID=671143 RepID=D5MKL9_METO1